MSLEHQPLTLQTFADGNLARDVDAILTDILERFRKFENGEIELADEKAQITLKLTIVRNTKVGGFECSYQEPGVRLPPRVSKGVVAIERDGILVVAVESDGTQIRLPSTSTPNA